VTCGRAVREIHGDNPLQVRKKFWLGIDVDDAARDDLWSPNGVPGRRIDCCNHDHEAVRSEMLPIADDSVMYSVRSVIDENLPRGDALAFQVRVAGRDLKKIAILGHEDMLRRDDSVREACVMHKVLNCAMDWQKVPGTNEV